MWDFNEENSSQQLLNEKVKSTLSHMVKAVRLLGFEIVLDKLRGCNNRSTQRHS